MTCEQWVRTQESTVRVIRKMRDGKPNFAVTAVGWHTAWFASESSAWAHAKTHLEIGK